ncbi:helix-turn-helix domain-containing protein [Bacillus gaemokensis]|uniref:HTH cro/C1-type domain-containing protein n=1 Tax=Bacillus gaemokensis TaxID=574375 RepID=A0A073KBF7_9BACI|nr:helix-turn-helix domain-containing protein [Bacillus gaemokensis]KEK23895.1 hypothetical protein BAGA_05495 [Bacillus gaemokensis]KYG38136.1 hypothetical protein AZF08_20525 [Bacillus gaemokensis]
MGVIGEIFEILGTNANNISLAIGVTRHTVYDWMKGRRKIPSERVKQLSELLKVPHYLFEKEGELDRSEKLLLLEVYATSILGEEASVRLKR